MNVLEMMAKVKFQQEAGLTKLSAMTTAEKEQYALDQEAKAIEVEEILKQLRGSPGFVELRGD